jgi:1,4-alpha-glucan branching enzyme
VPQAGRYRKLIDSDATRFGGSGYSQQTEIEAEPQGWRDFPARLQITLPPLAMVIFERIG